ncbi:MAG: hypothetical protein JZU50_13250 [Desulfobulbaceae bacterium]|jgi:hydroxymethylglutaryl-CoA lyase|nr:hypothetical protein [Desulfobulbaceae bacterium]
MSQKIQVVLEEESLRDGLLAESRLLGLTEKLHIVRLLKDAGVKRLQLGSFGHPRSVPQMANTDVLVSLARKEFPDLLSTALVPNEKGLERAVHCGLGLASMSVSASDSYSLRTVGRPAAEALELTVALIGASVKAGTMSRAGVQCAFGCVFEGVVPEETVLAFVDQLVAAGATEINLADTAGMANPLQVERLVAKVRAAYPEVELSLHLYDTRGLGLVNMYAGCVAGVRLFSVAAGGLGASPLFTGASGNVASEDAVNLFHGMGLETGIDLVGLCRVVDYYETLLARKLPGRMNRVLHSQPEALAKLGF